VNDAILACRRRADGDWLVILGFGFESDVDNRSVTLKVGSFEVTKVRMHDDLMQDGLIKKDKKAASFVTIGEPDIATVPATLADGSPGVAVEIRGLDLYDPMTDEVKERSAADISYWMVDERYDGANFVATQVFFCGGDKDEFDKWKRGLSALAVASAKAKAEKTLEAGNRRRGVRAGVRPAIAPHTRAAGPAGGGAVHAVRRAGPGAREVSRRAPGGKGDASRIFDFCAAIVDATARPGVRLQAADRLLRRAPRRRPARAADGAHPPRGAGGAGDPGRQARRHRQHRRAVRARGLRALRRRRGHAVALHGLRLGRALPGLRRQGPVPAVPHLQPRRRATCRPSACWSSGDSPAAAVRAHRPLAAGPWNRNGQLGLVVGATFPGARSSACARWRPRCRC
jgi:hypothetical protein